MSGPLIKQLSNLTMTKVLFVFIVAILRNASTVRRALRGHGYPTSRDPFQWTFQRKGNHVLFVFLSF